MSTKSTIILTNCCHIYRDYQIDENGFVLMDKPTLCIEVSYGATKACSENPLHQEYNDYIEVEYDSHFSRMIQFMVEHACAEGIDKYCRAIASEEQVAEIISDSACIPKRLLK